RPAQLAAVRCDEDKLRDVARPAITSPRERRQHLLDMAALGPAGGLHARGAAERRQLDPGVVGEHPAVGRPDLAPEPGLDARVVEIGWAVLDRVLGRVEQLDLPLRQRLAHLDELARVRRAQRDLETASRQLIAAAAGGPARGALCPPRPASRPPALPPV